MFKMVWVCKTEGCTNNDDFYREDVERCTIRGTREDVVLNYIDSDGDIQDSETTTYGDVETEDSDFEETIEQGTVYCSDCNSEAEWIEPITEGEIVVCINKKVVEIEGENYV